MKILAVEFPEGTVVTIPKGATVQISDGTTTMSNGKLAYIIDAAEEEVVVPAHTHPIAYEVTGETGEPT